MFTCTECASEIGCGDPSCLCDNAMMFSPTGAALCNRCGREAWARYDVVRFFRERPGYEKVIKRNVSLAEARAHCNDPETSSATATNRAAVQRTRKHGPWFDGYRSVS